MRRHQEGFTLIELLVVISIIAVLTGIGLTSFQNAQAKARDAKRKEDLAAIQTALQAYYNDHGSYPIPTTNNYWVNSTALGTWIPGLTSQYIKTLPLDPINSGCSSNTTVAPADTSAPPNKSTCFAYAYYSGGSYCNIYGQGYILTTNLEGYSGTDLASKNLGDPTTGAACYWPSSGTTTGIYTIINP